MPAERLLCLIKTVKLCLGWEALRLKWKWNVPICEPISYELQASYISGACFLVMPVGAWVCVLLLAGEARYRSCNLHLIFHILLCLCHFQASIVLRFPFFSSSLLLVESAIQILQPQRSADGSKKHSFLTHRREIIMGNQKRR